MPGFDEVRAACGLVIAGGKLQGTAFLISPTLAITAAHAVEGDDSVKLIYPEGQFAATRDAVSEQSDTAILRLNKPIDGVQPLAFSFDATRGDRGYIYGFPFVFEGTGLPIDVRIQDPSARIHGVQNPLLLLSLPPNINNENLLGFSGAPVIVGDAVVGLVVRSFGHKLEGFLGAAKIQAALEILPAAEYARAKRRAQPTAPRHPGEHAGVGVVAALDEELDYLLDLPYEWSGPKPMDDGVTYRTGRMPDGATIVAATANSMGMIETAILTSKLIKAWSPRLIGMIGLCGGRKEKGLSIGDIVVPTQTFHYQFGAYKNGKLQKELRVENSDRQLLDIVTHLSKRTNTLAKIKSELPRGFPKPPTELRCHQGPMASADLVVKDVDKIQEAIDADRKTIAIEMESYAFMKAAALGRVRWTVVAKSVSDYADVDKNDDFRDYAKHTSTLFFTEIAQALMSTGLIDSAA
jgi:nucleoside phosphorylase